MPKGAETRDRILWQAVRLASRDGLDGLSIGGLAAELNLSKSGLFAHFGSKETLQLDVLQAAVDRFTDVVVRPAIKLPRGTPRIKALFKNWMAWSRDPSLPGGCIFINAAVEVDDQPGPLRDFLVRTQRDWLGSLAKAARLAIEEGHLRRDLDPDQFAFELYAVILAYHHARRLLRDGHAGRRAQAAFDRLLETSRAVAASKK
jgi:AcrR family transcriptional regulator